MFANEIDKCFNIVSRCVCTKQKWRNVTNVDASYPFTHYKRNEKILNIKNLYVSTYYMSDSLRLLYVWVY